MFLPNLSDVTLVAVTSRDHALTVRAARQCLERCQPADIFILTDRVLDFPYRLIPPLRSMADYNRMVTLQLAPYIKTDYLILFHWDSYILNSQAWQNRWRDYDYIGAPWWYSERNVGNGGFSWRSKKLLTTTETVRQKYHIDIAFFDSTEDELLCRSNFTDLLQQEGCCFAPTEVAQGFAYETWPHQEAFGFHGFFNFPRVCSEQQLHEVVEALHPSHFNSAVYMRAVVMALDLDQQTMAQYLMARGVAHNNQQAVAFVYQFDLLEKNLEVWQLEHGQKRTDVSYDILRQKYRQLAAQHGIYL